MAITFADIEAAVAATVKPVVVYGRIGGTAVTVTEATVRHGVDQPVGTCTVVVEAPRPATLEIGAELEVEAGYPGASRRIFWGRIPLDEAAIDDRGKWCRVEGEGYEARLRHRGYATIELDGPISLKDAFRSLCELRSVPAYLADDTTYVDGVTEIMLGGNADIDGGNVVIDASTSPLDWLTRTAKLFGYRAFGCPDGAFRLARISGLPNDASSMSYQEGVNAYRFVNRRDSRPQVTYWEVRGATYTAADGGRTSIRSIPESVENGVFGYVPSDTISNSVLVTDTQATGARNAHEVDYSEVWTGETWECDGHPALQPGDVVTVTSPTVGVDTLSDRWLMSITQSVSDRGYEATMEGWAGAGEALAAGNDCVTEPVTISGDGILHLGNQTISRYADPTADGTTATLTITVNYADYSSLRLTGKAHGTNSYSRRSASTGSVVEIWQLPDPSAPQSGTNELRRVGSIELPTLDENSHLNLDYDNDANWTAFSLPISGSLKTGAAEIRIIAGDNPDGKDDFEIKGLELTYCGVGIPTLPAGN